MNFKGIWAVIMALIIVLISPAASNAIYIQEHSVNTLEFKNKDYINEDKYGKLSHIKNTQTQKSVTVETENNKVINNPQTIKKEKVVFKGENKQHFKLYNAPNKIKSDHKKVGNQIGENETNENVTSDVPKTVENLSNEEFANNSEEMNVESTENIDEANDTKTVNSVKDGIIMAGSTVVAGTAIAVAVSAASTASSAAATSAVAAAAFETVMHTEAAFLTAEMMASGLEFTPAVVAASDAVTSAAATAASAATLSTVATVAAVVVAAAAVTVTVCEILDLCGISNPVSDAINDFFSFSWL